MIIKRSKTNHIWKVESSIKKVCKKCGCIKDDKNKFKTFYYLNDRCYSVTPPCPGKSKFLISKDE